MNALFHLNMQFQQADVERKRLLAQQAAEKSAPGKDSTALIYLNHLLKNKQATSQELYALSHSGIHPVRATLRYWIRHELVEYEPVNQRGGIYRLAEGVTAADFGFELDEQP